MKVFISTTTFAEYNKEPLDFLKRNKISYALNPYKRKLTKEEIFNILKKNSYVGLIAGTESLTKEALKSAKALKVISRVGIGMDNIDLNAARKLKIRIYNTPHVLVDSVAELTIGLIICCLRKITFMDRCMRNNLWRKETGLLFKNKILGIIGFGKIGKRVAQLAKALNANIIYYDIKPIRYKRFTQVSLNKLLKDSDIISIHSSSKDRLITKEELSKMKNGVILINTSRGSIIDESALYEALRCKRIAFAAMDVFNKEPYSGKLTCLDNIVLLPHIGSYAKESRIQMEKEAVRNLIKGLREVGLS